MSILFDPQYERWMSNNCTRVKKWKIFKTSRDQWRIFHPKTISSWKTPLSSHNIWTRQEAFRKWTPRTARPSRNKMASLRCTFSTSLPFLKRFTEYLASSFFLVYFGVFSAEFILLQIYADKNKLHCTFYCIFVFGGNRVIWRARELWSNRFFCKSICPFETVEDGCAGILMLKSISTLWNLYLLVLCSV